LAAVVAPGLHLAFQNRKRVQLGERTILGESASREIWVCGSGAFIVLKALAFHIRGENKDAYDLFYVIRNYGDAVADVAGQLRPLLTDESAKTALAHLRSDFLDPKAVGPRRLAEFLYGREDANLQADAAAFVRQLLEECSR